MSRRATLRALLVAGALVAGGCGGGNKGSNEVRLDVDALGVQGGPPTVQVPRGKTVVFVVDAHVKGNVLIPAYSIKRPVAAEQTVRVPVVASKLGNFLVSFSPFDTTLAHLVVVENGSAVTVVTTTS
jgi:hypothetical protein